jgi:hypothetical protein
MLRSSGLACFGSYDPNNYACRIACKVTIACRLESPQLPAETTLREKLFQVLMKREVEKGKVERREVR